MDAFLGPPKDVSLLSDVAYDSIREAILDLRLKPGSALVETKLAEALNMSKTPIRQALKQLEQSGLVVATPYKGYFVSELTIHDAWEILQIRIVLEGLAAREACLQLTDNDLNELIQLIDDAEKAFERGDVERCAELGHAFHRYLVVKANNGRLSAMIDQLNDQFARVRLLSYRVPGRLTKSMNEHELVLEALQGRDPFGAEALMRSHLQNVYEDLEGDESLSPNGLIEDNEKK